MKSQLDYQRILGSTRALLKRSKPANAVGKLVKHVAELTGRDPFDLDTVDLEAEVQNIASQLDSVFKEHPPPNLECLLVHSYVVQYPEDDHPWVACWIGGQDSFRPHDLEWACEPLYSASQHQIRCQFLDKVRAHGEEDEENEWLVWLTLFQPAMGVLFYRAVRLLERSYTVVVSTGDVDSCYFVLR